MSRSKPLPRAVGGSQRFTGEGGRKAPPARWILGPDAILVSEVMLQQKPFQRVVTPEVQAESPLQH
jgi:hypothetical protein